MKTYSPNQEIIAKNKVYRARPYPDWRGYLISGFSLIWIANAYMSLFFLIRTDLKNDGLDSKIKESELEKCAVLRKEIKPSLNRPVQS